LAAIAYNRASTFGGEPCHETNEPIGFTHIGRWRANHLNMIREPEYVPVIAGRVIHIEFIYLGLSIPVTGFNGATSYRSASVSSPTPSPVVTA